MISKTSIILMSVIVSMILSVAPAYADYQERIEKIQTQIQKHENRILVLEDKKDGSNDANMDERIQRLQDKIADKQAIIDRLSDAIDNTPVPDTGHESVPDTGHESVPDTGHESVPDTGHESVPDTGHESVPEPVIEDSSDLERIQTMNTNLNAMAVQISELISHFAEMRSELMSMTQTAPITTPDPIEINTLENHIMIDKTHYLAGETVHVSGWMDLNEPRHHQLVDGTHVYRNLETRFTLSVDGTDPTTQRLGPYGQTWINHVNHIVGHPHGNDDDCTMTLSKDLTVHDEFCTLGNLTVFSNGTFTSNFNVDILQLAGMYELKFGAHHGTYEKLLSNEFRVGP